MVMSAYGRTLMTRMSAYGRTRITLMDGYWRRFRYFNVLLR